MEEAGDEAVLAVGDVNAEGLDDGVFVGRGLEAGEVWGVGEARVFVD